MSNERRAVPRAQYAGDVVVAISGDVLLCQGVDLSEQGIAFSSPSKSIRSKAHEERVVLTFGLPRLGRWLVVEGVVVRVSTFDQCSIWAVRFTNLLPRIGRILRTFVFAGHGEVLEFCA